MLLCITARRCVCLFLMTSTVRLLASDSGGCSGPAVCAWQLATWGVSPSDTAIEGMEGRPRGIELEVSNHVM